MKNVVLTLLIFLLAAPAFALELALPVACTLGSNCWVQQYFDQDSGAGSTDYACGVASYDGHDGTDIRILNTSISVDVVASAAGVVKGTRDGVEDRLVKTEVDKDAVDKIECGNGVVVDHGEGWQTQYCHLRKGSVKVRSGQRVEVGAVLGSVGYSGKAAFPHVHLSVRKNGKKIDPFSADVTTDCKADDRSLWTAKAQQELDYQSTQLLQLAWAPRIYEEAEVEAGKFPEFSPGNWPALVLFAEAINLYKDDVLTLTVVVPGVAPIIKSTVLPRNRAVQRQYAGLKIPGKWVAGAYSGRVDVMRAGKAVLSREITFEIGQ